MIRQIPFGDLHRHYCAMKDEIDAAIARVLQSGWFVLGDEGQRFESDFARYVGAAHGIGVGSGTEALHLALTACDLRPGEEVITVPNTAVPTLSAISFAGLVPVLVDVEADSFCMNPDLLEAAITAKTRAVIPVHLYGNTCDMAAVMEVAEKHQLFVIEDACQAHGAMFRGKMAGTFGHYGAFSFYPSKNLAAFGDGGMVVCNDDRRAEKIALLRNYGQSQRYYHDIVGFNSRLDELQAAILTAQLPHLSQWNDRRRQIAAGYTEKIKHEAIRTPRQQADRRHVFHLYVIRCAQRDRLRRHLAENGIGTQIHYPVPCHLQNAYKYLGLSEGDYPVAETLAREILSLPIYPEMGDDEVDYVCEVINRF